jgi:predicted nuclease with TOPRIM domain
MDVKDYCSQMQSELTGWKAKVYDAIRKTEKMPEGKKDNVAPHMGELHALIDDISHRIEILNTECPADWEPEKAEIESRVSQLKTKWSQVWDEYGIAEY